MNEKEIFATNLIKNLKLNNLTQLNISKDLKFKQSTVSDWMTAKKFPRIDKLNKIAEYFGVSVSDLIEEKHSDHDLSENELYLLKLYNQANDDLKRIIIELLEL